jgi:outer membrane protein assembly factor BamB
MCKRDRRALVVGALMLCASALVERPARAVDQVLQNHGDAQRSGLYVTPQLTWQRARGLHRDARFSGEISGAVYAQPLYWSPPQGGAPLLLVATETNRTYALDARSGTVVWQRSLGAPAESRDLPCGDINPLGVTGTPVIDARSETVFLDAMVHDAAGPRHKVFALSLKDGTLRAGWPVDVAERLRATGESFDAAIHNERGALAILDDRLYVPYGGHFGDCRNYHGWVVGLSLRDPPQIVHWATRARGGGIWAPGGVVSDGAAIYVTTGNTIGAEAWGDGEAVIRLGLDLKFSRSPSDFFAPADWSALDNADLDLGATNPALLDVVGATPARLALALGKDGKAYLLDRQKLGGIGGALAVKRVSDEQIRTLPAVYPGRDGTFVVFRGSGVGCPRGQTGELTALAVKAGAPPRLEVAWCAGLRGRGAPIVTTTDGRFDPIVWVVDAERGNRLYGYRGDTGEILFDGGGEAEHMGLVRRFSTPIAAGERLYVAGDGRVYAFEY